MKKFPYSVYYPRTANWFTGGSDGSDWYPIAEWCNQTFGQGNWDWDSLSQCFLFEHESHVNWFKLRWK